MKTLCPRFAVLIVLALTGCPESAGNPPKITSIEVQGRAPGTYVTIRGTDFRAGSGNTVKFGSATATVTAANSAEIVCQIPETPAGTSAVTVTTPAGSSNSFAYQVGTDASSPSIASISPRVAHPGDVVTIQGKNFGSSPEVQFGILFTGSVLSSTTTSIQVEVPLGAWSEPVTVGASNGVTLMITTDAAYPQSAPGSEAQHFLKSGSYASILIEIDYVAGRKPSQGAVDLLVQRLAERCRKPGGITCVFDDEISSGGVTVWSNSSLKSLEALHRDHYSSTGTR